MGIFSRYLIRRFLYLLIIAVGCSLVIFIVIDFVENTKTWLNQPRQEVWNYYLNYVPHILYLVLPVALLIASVFSVGNMARHLELVAMRAAGRSVYSITFPLLFLGILITGGMFWFGDTILPDANYERFKIKEPKTKENTSGNPNEKYKFVFIGPKNVTYFFQHYSGNRKSGRGVTILMERGDTLYQRYDCKRLVWENHWKAIDGSFRTFENGRIATTKFKDKLLKELTDTPADLVNNRVFPDEMRMVMLKRRIDILKRSGEQTRRFETQWHFKISSCVVNLIMLVIGFSIAANTMRSGLIKRFGLTLLFTFCYFVLLRFGLIFGENGTLTPVMGAWMGNMVFGSMALGFYANMGRL
ncbi:MAG: LptF/LptG family permease [Fibrobacteria bacterium]|nr:LptF/LptG family permease [Fibrobacteria bacterium]